MTRWVLHGGSCMLQTSIKVMSIYHCHIIIITNLRLMGKWMPMNRWSSHNVGKQPMSWSSHTYLCRFEILNTQIERTFTPVIKDGWLNNPPVGIEMGKNMCNWGIFRCGPEGYDKQEFAFNLWSILVPVGEAPAICFFQTRPWRFNV